MERLLLWTDEKQMLDQNVRKRLNPDPAQMVGLVTQMLDQDVRISLKTNPAQMVCQVTDQSLLERKDSQNQMKRSNWIGNKCTYSHSLYQDFKTYFLKWQSMC